LAAERPLNILHLAGSHRWTGAAEPATDLACAQADLGHRVRLACVEGHSFWQNARARGVDLVGGFAFQTGAHVISLRRDVHRLRRLLHEEKFDVVHCHLALDHWIAGAALAVPYSKIDADGQRPILVRTAHRDVPPRRDPFSRRLFGKITDLVITVSSSGRRRMIEFLGLPEDHAVFIRGAVDLERFHPGLDRMINRKTWELGDATPLAGIVARMQPHRGHLAFIDALEPVLATVPDARFLVTGRGELKKKVDERIYSHPRQEHLIRGGYRKHDLAETYAAMDVSVLLAQGSDGTCRAMLEAMACGRPVIGVRVGAIEDTIEPGVNGWLIGAAPAYEGLAGALIEALGNLDRTAGMGRAARALMEREFTQQRRARNTLDAYHAALERVRHAAAVKS
jgi:glycosyltransferase involved in cell wall biosynthesis